jgi:hypothetical protein
MRGQMQVRMRYGMHVHRGLHVRLHVRRKEKKQGQAVLIVHGESDAEDAE